MSVRRVSIGAFWGGVSGIVLVVLIGLLSSFSDCKNWRICDFGDILNQVACHVFLTFLYYGILLIPLCCLAGALIKLGRENHTPE